MMFNKCIRDIGSSFTIFFFALSAQANSINLSDFFSASGSVSSEYQIAADGSKVVFTADYNGDDYFELYSIGLDGSQPKRIDTFGDFRIEDDNDFEVAPNGEYVVYTAETDNERGLFVRSLISNNAETVRIVVPVNLLTNFGSFLSISPDSSFVLFSSLPSFSIVNNQVLLVSHLLTANIQGGQLNSVSTIATDNGLAFFHAISPQSDHVVYVLSSPGLDDQLVSVSTSGGTANVLSDDIAIADSADRRIFLEDISPDGRFVIYRRSFIGDNSAGIPAEFGERFITTISGSGIPQRIHPELSGDQFIAGIRVPSFDLSTISPDGSSLYYFLGDSVSSSPFNLQHGTLNKVSNPLLSSSNTTFESFSTLNGLANDLTQYSSDSNSLFYTAFGGNVNAPSSVSLYKNNEALIPQSSEMASNMRFVKNRAHSNDGNKAVIVAGPQFTGSVDQIFSYDASSSVAEFTQLSNFDTVFSSPIGFAAGNVTYSADFTPDLDTVIVGVPRNVENLLQDGLSGIIKEILAIPFSGGPVTKLTPELESDRNITSFQISPDSRRIVYRADQGQDEIFELYSVEITPSIDSELCVPIKSISGNFSIICF